MIVCAGDSESFEFALPIGIGLVASSINLTKLCMLNPPEFLLFVGSAGSYGGSKIFDIVESSKSSNIEIGYFDKNSYTPINNIIIDENANVSRETLSDKIVNSSNYITTSKEKSEQFLRADIAIENMEFFSIASIAQAFNIPFRGIFCVTNFCDENAHEDFKKNHKQAMELLALHVNKFYKKLLKK